MTEKCVKQKDQIISELNRQVNDLTMQFGNQPTSNNNNKITKCKKDLKTKTAKISAQRTEIQTLKHEVKTGKSGMSQYL